MKVYYKPRTLINFCVLFDKGIYKLLSYYNCLQKSHRVKKETLHFNHLFFPFLHYTLRITQEQKQHGERCPLDCSRYNSPLTVSRLVNPKLPAQAQPDLKQKLGPILPISCLLKVQVNLQTDISKVCSQV